MEARQQRLQRHVFRQTTFLERAADAIHALQFLALSHTVSDVVDAAADDGNMKMKIEEEYNGKEEAAFEISSSSSSSMEERGKKQEPPATATATGTTAAKAQAQEKPQRNDMGSHNTAGTS